MRVLRGLSELSADRFRAPVVTIGVFDGVHRGHRALLARAREMSARANGELVVITFDRHPREITTGNAPPLITSLPHRLVLLGREGVDTTIVLAFDEQLREMSAEDFVEDILVRRLGVQAVVLGHDSHFGHNRRGDFAFVHGMLTPRGIPVERTEAVTLTDGRIISSSTIREAVARTDIDAAARLLGRPPALYGTVVRGAGRGRELGFPTANLDLGHELRPVRGVYGGSVQLDGRVYAAAINIGGRPTFHPEGEAADTVEVHLLDLPAGTDLYGRALEVVLLGRVRDEQRFASVEALREQVAADIAGIRARLASGEWRLG